MLITDSKELKRFASCHRVWQGIPGIVRTKGGRTFVSFYSGNVKETYGNFAALIRSEDGDRFSEPIAVAEKTGKYRCFDPVLWIDPLGRLWFIWNVMPGEQVMASICDDPDEEFLVWNDEFCIGRGIMMNKPIVLSSGEWLFPVATWKPEIYREFRQSEMCGMDVAGSYVLKTSDNGKTFVRLGHADVRDRSFDEHMVLELQNGVLMMLVRTNYGIGVSYSYDRGKNWSKGEDSKLGGPCSRFFISRLRSGRVLMINHVNFTKRNNLTALLSEDDGKTFPYSILLDERNSVSYPDAVQDENGDIHIVYDRERGGYKSSLAEAYSCAREILTAKIREEDIMNGSIVSSGSYLKNVVCKLGELASGDPDPYQETSVNDGDFADQLLQSGEGDILEKVFEKYPVNCCCIRDFNAKKLDGLIQRFQQSGSCDEVLLKEIIGFVRQTPTGNGEPSPIIDLAKEEVEKYLAEEFSVSALADKLKVSVYYLSHLFKSVTGTTVLEYRNELRLTKAKLLLIHTEETVSEIAQRLGFCSSAYFTELFTGSEKIPPSEYRKYHKQ